MSLEALKDKKVTIGAVIAVLLGSGSYVAIEEPVYDILDERYVTIASQNVELEFEIEDELDTIAKEIARKLQLGEDITDELVRTGVLEDRLRRLRKEEP